MGRHKGRGKISNFFKKANKFLRKTKLISTYGDYIPVVGNTVSKVAGVLGYGRRKRVKGKGFFSKLKKWNSKLRDGKYISKYGNLASKIATTVGNATGNATIQRAANIASNMSDKAKALGYGRVKGGRRLAMNGMGRLITPQQRTQMFCESKLAMI